MTTPYIPKALSSPVLNPSVGSVGAAPIPYISAAQYQFAPTAMSIGQLVPGGTTTKQLQALADVIRRASRWADNICFGADPAGKASLAASLSVESQWVRVIRTTLRLVCSYKPPIELVGCDVGLSATSLSSIGSTLAGAVRFGFRTIYVPYGGAGVVFRSGDIPAPVPFISTGNRLYAVWSYVNGFAHTKLAADVTKTATSCEVTATDGDGGLWGVYAATATKGFLGTQLQVIDGVNTEIVSVKSVTKGSSTTTLTTSAFQHAHTVPTAPTFIPVTAVPEDVAGAIVTLTSAWIKTSRGSRTREMPMRPGGPPTKERMAQAGALGNYETAVAILHPYGVRTKAKN